MGNMLGLLGHDEILLDRSIFGRPKTQDAHNSWNSPCHFSSVSLQSDRGWKANGLLPTFFFLTVPTVHPQAKQKTAQEPAVPLY